MEVKNVLENGNTFLDDYTIELDKDDDWDVGIHTKALDSVMITYEVRRVKMLDDLNIKVNLKKVYLDDDYYGSLESDWKYELVLWSRVATNMYEGNYGNGYEQEGQTLKSYAQNLNGEDFVFEVNEEVHSDSGPFLYTEFLLFDRDSSCKSYSDAEFLDCYNSENLDAAGIVSNIVFYG